VNFLIILFYEMYYIATLSVCFKFC